MNHFSVCEVSLFFHFSKIKMSKFITKLSHQLIPLFSLTPEFYATCFLYKPIQITRLLILLLTLKSSTIWVISNPGAWLMLLFWPPMNYVNSNIHSWRHSFALVIMEPSKTKILNENTSVYDCNLISSQLSSAFPHSALLWLFWDLLLLLFFQATSDCSSFVLWNFSHICLKHSNMREVILTFYLLSFCTGALRKTEEYLLTIHVGALTDSHCPVPLGAQYYLVIFHNDCFRLSHAFIPLLPLYHSYI